MLESSYISLSLTFSPPPDTKLIHTSLQIANFKSTAKETSTRIREKVSRIGIVSIKKEIENWKVDLASQGKSSQFKFISNALRRFCFSFMSSNEFISSAIIRSLRI